MSRKELRRLLLALLSMLIICSAWISGVQLAAGSQPSDLGWTVASNSPNIGDYAVAVTGAGESIYIANSTKTAVNYFMQYNTVDNNWYSLSNPPQWFKNGTAIAWDGGNYIYALMGASYNDIQGGGRFYFYRYSISGNSWTKLADTPHTCGAGDALSFVPGWAFGVSNDNFLYAILGSNEPSGSQFRRYSIAGDSWSAAISFPWENNTDDGCSLVWAGDNYLYALEGENHESIPSRDFARFRLTDNTWQNLPPIPDFGGVGDGGSLLWVGGGYSDYVYALGGGGAREEPGKKFFAYKISGNSWIELADLPAGVTDQTGSRLGSSEGDIYAWRGTFGDKVLWVYSPIHANVVTLTTNDDSFVHSSRPDDTFGSWTTIYVGRYTNGGGSGPERVFLKFDLLSIPDNNVVDVKLYLYCWGVDGGGANIQGHSVDNDNWNEGTITWNNMPAIGGILDGPHSVDDRGQYSWTVTDFVRDQFENDPQKLASFCLIDADENNAPDHAANFDSKEWTDNFQWPYLKITYAPLYGVDVSISPDNQSGLPGGTLSYVVTVTNTGQLDDNYDLSASDDASWGLSISPPLLEVPAGENGSVTLSVTIAEDATPCTSDKITVTATSQSDPLVSDSATCIAHRVDPNLGLATLYEVSLEFDAYVDNRGSKLVLKFYTYNDIFQGENVVWSGPTPDNVIFSKSVPHPEENKVVENVTLVLTGEDTEDVITTIDTLTVTRNTLNSRLVDIYVSEWPFASPQERDNLNSEIVDIYLQWPFAPF